MRRVVALFLVVFSVGCAALLGVDDVRYFAGDASPPPNDAPSPDSPSDAALPAPSFCSGITFYAPFDGSLFAFDEPASPRGDAGISFIDGGVAGQALALRGAVEVQWAREFAGRTIATATQGSVAFWVRPTLEWGCTLRDVGVPSYGVLFADNSGVFNVPSLSVDWSSQSIVFSVADTSQDGAPTRLSSALNLCNASFYLNKSPFYNHIALTWRERAGAALYLNGGGNSPTFLSVDAGWRSSVDSSRIELDLVNTPLDADYDELIVWNRELRADEVLALYEAQSMTPARALRDLCACAADAQDNCL